MAQPIQNYPITFAYGATDNTYYYAPTPGHPKTASWVGYFHRGNDLPLQEEPIIIGNTTIGISGQTGAAGGLHCHVQAGTDLGVQQVVDSRPYIGKPGTIVKTGYGNQWGSHVIIKVDNIYVAYCHLKSIDVTVGTIIHAEDNVAIIQNEDNWRSRLSRTMQDERGRDLSEAEFQDWVGKDFLHFVEAVQDNPEADTWRRTGVVGRVALRDNWQQQIVDLTNRTNDMTNTIASITSERDALRAQINPSVQVQTAVDSTPQVTNEQTKSAPVIKKAQSNKLTLGQTILLAAAKAFQNRKK